MNTLQTIQLEMLRSFLDVCQTLGLQYYLVCGSALGAVKYGGFIPWDDDVDIAMPRRDYEIFCARAQSLLPAGIFVQNYRTDSRFPAIYTKLRNDNTTFIETASAALPIHHGVYIDIFPLDGYPAGKLARSWLELRKSAYKLLLLSAFQGNYSRKVRILLGLFRLLGVHKHTDRIAEKYEGILKAHPLENSILWCNHGNWQGKKDYAPADHYAAGTWAAFEGLTVRIPQQYDSYLTRKYGDFRSDLPPHLQVSHHACTVCDCEKPYTAYIRAAGQEEA